MSSGAQWWKMREGAVQCLLCPHHCVLRPGSFGRCGVRGASDDGLIIPGRGFLTAQAVDPIEKKPLYHVWPGRPVFSVGFAGCNMHCPFCQNHGIASASAGTGIRISPKEVVHRALESGSSMIAYTYSEPTIHFEYVMDCAGLASDSGLLNILVTNGNLTSGPAEELLGAMDAANIDLKSWDAGYYRSVLGGDLETVKAFISTSHRLCHTEITTLIVPGDNDSDEEAAAMAAWIAAMSPDIPYHISAYHPSHRYTRPATSASRVNQLAAIARRYLKFVYVGNIGIGNDTDCPSCGRVLIRRRYYNTLSELEEGRCPDCGYALQGLFT